MNITLKQYLVAGFLVLSLGTTNHVTAAAKTQIEMAQVTNTAIKNLEAALEAVSTNRLDDAQKHMDASRYSANYILGACSIAAKKERGSNALKKARRHIKNGDTAGATISLKEAIRIFKTLLLAVNNGRPNVFEWFK